jgi:Zinc carboxypeptidase
MPRVKRHCALAAAAFLIAFSATAAPPTPAGYFGHEIGADKTVLDWDKVVSYFRLLEKSSDRLRVAELGKSTEGRPFIAVTISQPETLKHLDRYIDIQRRLADPRITTAADAEKLIHDGKTIVLITCSIHSTEIASTHTAVEFAYRLLTEDKLRFKTILENTIFILVPSLNPDGVDIVSQWYRKTLGTPYEGTTPPQLYHKYVGHDNNRDWYIFSQVETRMTISKLHNVWHPQIVYDVHQQGSSSSRMFVPPWMDPIEPNIDAILMQETNMIGTSMAADLTAAGKTGISIHSSYDFWTPSRHYQAFHGGMRILTESASARLASPITLKFEQLDETALGYNAQQRSWNYLEPWPGGTWHLRDIIDYQLVAMESCLYNAAIRREDLLRNFYKIGQRQVARKSPWGFLIPAAQRDPGATRKLLETLKFGAVEVEQMPDGDHLIRMSQPYSGWAKSLLERQNYPDLRMYPGGPPKRPYDVTAQTLPLLMGVDVRTLDGPPKEQSSATPHSDRKLLSASDSDSWKAVNRAWHGGGKVWRNTSNGDFATSAQSGDWMEIPRPRVGLYQSFEPSMDEGWTRWLLEQFGFAYTSVHNPDILAGRLRHRFDTLVFPDQSATVIDRGYTTRMPEEYRGGLGEKGAAALREFASAGGTVVFLNRSSEYAIQHLGIKAKNVVGGASNRDYYAPGSLLNVKLTAGHPITQGLPDEIPIWSEHSPAWDTEEVTVAKYPQSHVLASGWLLGEKLLAGRSALVDARLGQGHVVLFGLRPQYRAQSYQTFKLFFNALLYK